MYMCDAELTVVMLEWKSCP